MRDPLYHDDSRRDQLTKDNRVMAVLTRLQWLKLATGLVALGLIGAVWVMWRWG